ncbi:MAG: translation initiation factor Sui1 [bacterium]|nr:translation initiation factor Sui1 [bacterium]
MKKNDLVYSSELGRICPQCEKPSKGCICKRKDAARPAGDGVVRIRREVKGRRGKTVTTISGLPLANDELRDLAARLKKRCGCGGSVADGVIIIQGDFRDVLRSQLEERGYRVKLAGG